MSFTKYDILIVLKGLNRLKLIPVKVMNNRAIMTYIKGVGGEEMPHFVKHMSSCQKFIVFVYQHEAERNVSVLTVFDDNVEDQYVYGKGRIDNLSMLLKSSNMKIKSTTGSQEIKEIRSEDNDIDFKRECAVHVNHSEDTVFNNYFFGKYSYAFLITVTILKMCIQPLQNAALFLLFNSNGLDVHF
jgi:hypothetical protein